MVDTKVDGGSENGSNKDTGKCHIQALERPHQSSYYLPGKLERRPIQFLIDTGCNTNLLSKHAFDQLPQKITIQLEENDRYGLLADRSQLQFYGVIHLVGWIRDIKIEENFVVGQINEDAILGCTLM